jgi:hypothetical protein
MIRFFLTRGHSYTLKKVRRARKAPAVSLMNYDALLRARWLRRATCVFTDVDRLGSWDLELASQAYLQLKLAGVTVLNNPATVKTRYPLLRALHPAGLNDFNAYRVAELDGAVRFPVFLRKIYGHREPLSDLLQTRGLLDQTIAAAVNARTPVENLLIVEFAAEPVREGLYRKLAAFRIGDAIVPHSSVHDTHWLVKYGKLGIAGEELYREELESLQTNPFAEHLKKVFDLANIEYGRADFGFYRGRIQIYEINTNPYVAPGEPHPSPVREQSVCVGWEKYLSALRAIDSGGGWPVRLANGKLQRHRPWKNLLTRTRKVP